MKKMRHLLAVFLCLSLLFSLCGLGVMADSTERMNIAVDENGDLTIDNGGGWSWSENNSEDGTDQGFWVVSPDGNGKWVITLKPSNTFLEVVMTEGSTNRVAALNNDGTIADGSVLYGSVVNYRSISGVIENHGSISAGSQGTISGTVNNYGTLDASQLTEATTLNNYTTISKGKYSCNVNNYSVIEGGTFTGTVDNQSRISGGTFEAGSTVANEDLASISGGSFYGSVVNKGSIEGEITNYGTIVAVPGGSGTISGTVNNYGALDASQLTEAATLNNYTTISEGEYSCNVNNYSVIEGGTFKEKELRNMSGGVISGGTFSGTVAVTNEVGGSITGGTFDMDSILHNHGSISGGSFAYTVCNNGTITATESSTPIFTDEVINQAGGSTIEGGNFQGKVINNDTILNGSFHGEVENGVWISGGNFAESSSVSNKGIISNGTFGGRVFNDATIQGGSFSGLVNNSEKAVIEEGTFEENGMVINWGTINGGDFQQGVYNAGTINDGTFAGAGNGMIPGGGTDNKGIINGGTFTETVNNFSQSEIKGGQFNSNVGNYGTLSDGDFNGPVSNSGSIKGGDFSGEVYNSKEGVIEDGSFAASGSVENDGIIESGDFSGNVTNNKEAVIKNGTFCSKVDNFGIVENGSFLMEVVNQIGGKINGGSFAKGYKDLNPKPSFSFWDDEDEGETVSVRIKFHDVDEDSIKKLTVNLLKDGKKKDSEKLTAKGNWHHRWEGLSEDEDIDWDVELKEIPEGCIANVENPRGNYFVITLYKKVAVNNSGKPNPNTGYDFQGSLHD